VGVRLSTLVLKPSGTPFLVKESQQLNAGSSVKNILRFMMLEPRERTKLGTQRLILRVVQTINSTSHQRRWMASD
jgi:hypothetical protein